MDFIPLFYFFYHFIILFFFCILYENGFGPIKEATLLHCKDGIFGWEDFSPEPNRKNHVEFMDL